MGLFDIFRRRSKKNKAKEEEKQREQEQQEKNQQEKNDEQSNNKENDNDEVKDHNESTEDNSTDQVDENNKNNKNNENDQTSTSGSEESATNEKDKAEESNESQTDNSNDESEEKVTTENNTEENNNQVSEKSENDDENNNDEDSETKSTKTYEHGLAKSRNILGKKLNSLFANFRSVDEDFFDDLEDTLIESDVGFETAVKLSDELRDEVKLRNAKKRSEVQNVIVQKLIQLYDQNGNNENNQINFADKGPTVILFVGVNGTGKTTTIGKMANMYRQQGKKVLLAAADTFRAGAIEQLDVWAKRDNVDIVKKKEHSDPSSVVFDAVNKAKTENYDVLFVDTAGRLQNKVNLMNELAKMKKVLTNAIPEAPHEVMLVLDSTTGQNALNQAKLFKDVTDVTGITLTKLDGTAKGGIVLAIRNELHLPVKYVGLGEKVTDLKPFDANDFVYGLFKGLFK